MAALAHELGIHYFDLTEDVSTTKAILDLSATSKGVMAPQCGLAPGFVGIVAASQVESFDTCRAVRMRVGALPQHPTGSVAAVIEMVCNGALPQQGFIKQEQIDLTAFLATPTGRLFS